MKRAQLQRVAPELPVTAMREALAWYRDALGFSAAMTMPLGDYAIVGRDDVTLHLFLDHTPSPAACHVFVLGLEELAAEFEERGVSIRQPLQRKPWGTRDFRLLDPFGNELKFTEPNSE
jgi:uncharacterized glyoxalase superfamily protein PhnB